MLTVIEKALLNLYFTVKINICGMGISNTIKLKTIDYHSLPYPQLVDFNLTSN